MQKICQTANIIPQKTHAFQTFNRILSSRCEREKMNPNSNLRDQDDTKNNKIGGNDLPLFATIDQQQQTIETNVGEREARIFYMCHKVICTILS